MLRKLHTKKGSTRHASRSAHTRPRQRTRRLFHELLEDRRLLAGVTPNDPLFAQQWALDNRGQTGGVPDADTDAPAAWSVTTGSAATVVAMLDSGIDYTHEDLYLNIWINQGEIPAPVRVNLTDVDADSFITFRDLNDPANDSQVVDLNGNGRIDAGDLLNSPPWEDGIDTDGNGYVDDLIGWDWVSNDNDPMDDYWHGTRTAGIVGAVGNNGVGIAGVTWAVQLMALRFESENYMWTDESAVNAIDYAVLMGAPISSNSWGTNVDAGGTHPLIFDAIARAGQAGHLFVSAAGNFSQSIDPGFLKRYPAGYDLDSILSVAATNDDDLLASFSDWGLINVDLAAPGENILSTSKGGGYGVGSGTSYATPHVAGIAALLKSLHPQWGAIELKQRIMETVDPLPSLQGKTVTGGRVNAAAAVGSTLIDTPLFLDGFENGQWNGLWVEDSQNDWFTSTQRKTDGSYSAEVDGSASDATLTIASPINLLPYGSAELAFDWLIESGLDTGEYLALDLFNGTSWQEVAKLRGNVDTENAWHSPAVTIDGSYLVSNFQFRFRAKMSGSDEDANVDNVRLIATSPAGPPNQLPLAEDDTVTTAEDAAATIDVLANDSDPDLDVLQVESVTQGSHGAVVINGDGTLTYTPQANYFGSDNFTYTISDGRGGTDTASVSVTITSVNDAPVAVNDSATTTPNQAVAINVLGNDFDVDVDALNVDFCTNPANGSVINLGGGVLQYTPSLDFTGGDQFTYTVSDGHGGTDTATVSIAVQTTSSMHVCDLDGSARWVNKTKWTATVIANVLDGSGLPVANATVQGTWSNGITSTATTNSAGQATLPSGNVDKSVSSVTFTVTNITHATFEYTPGSNTDPDGDSNGTVITILKPQALLAASIANGTASAANLAEDVAEAAVSQALSLWSQQIVMALPPEVHVQVADIPAGFLGWASGNKITLDVNADGAGWYTDVGTPAAGRVDLLTVVSHEIGHVLGYGHSAVAGDLMYDTLTPGTKRWPGSAPMTMDAMLDSAIVSSLLLTERRDVPLYDLVDHPLLANEMERNAGADSDLWMLPLVTADYAAQPQRTTDTVRARIGKAITDEEMELLDDELLDLIAGGQK